MREILFKAKKWDNSKWVFGDLIQTESGDKFILPIEEPDLLKNIQVIPETVCQYIGIKDQVGNKIFENCIMKGRFGTGIGCESTKYKMFNFSVTHHGHSPEFHLNMPINYGRYRFCPHLTECLIIGNTFDNPELLQSL